MSQRTIIFCLHRFSTSAANETPTTLGDSSEECWHSLRRKLFQRDTCDMSRLLDPHSFLNASKFTNMINLKQHFAPQQLDIDETYKEMFAL